MKIRVLVVDDEKYSRESVKELLENYDDFDIVGEASSAEEALKKMRKLKPHVLFLDIQLPGISGLEFAKTLHRFKCIVVFVSAYEEYALEAFDVNAVDYLTKPVSLSRFEITVSKIMTTFRTIFPRIDKLPVKKDDDTIEFVDVDEICYIEEREKNAIVHLPKLTHVLKRTSLTSLQEKLPDEFVRVHKSYVVNITKVVKMCKRLGRWEMAMECGQRVPISKHLLRSVKKILDL